MKRSIGITIIGWSLILFVLPFWLIFYNDISQLGSYYILWTAVYSIVNIAIGIGVLKLKNWARILLFCLVVIKIVDVVFRSSSYLLESDTRITGLVDIISILLLGFFILWFFSRKSIKEQFRT